jgi:release factor glutamine methyltransferase
MSVSQAIQYAQSLGLERLDAQWLVLHALGRASTERAWLLAHGDDAMDTDAHTQLQQLAQRRADGEPLAYITGTKEFYGLTLAVDHRVLDPRADTETLVDWALEVMDAQHAASATPPTLIDLGTGSGAIALALQHSRALWQVHALDYSLDALTVARANAQRLGLEVVFHQGSWLQGVHEKFSVIVSNPPYIAAQDAHLAALHHEPLQALASGSDGLDDIRSIIGQAPAHLLDQGWLLLEHGYDQAEAVRALLLQAGFAQVQSRRDLAGIERCSGGQWTGSISTRLAQHVDVDAVAALFNAYRQFYEQPDDLPLATHFVGERMREQQSTVLVAEDGAGAMLGFCQIYPSFCSVLAAPIGVLYDLFVSPAARKRGVGRALLQAAAQHARDQGWQRLDLTTARTNVQAQSLYASLQWQRDDVFLAYNLDLRS